MQHSPTACITLVIQQTTFQGVVYSEDNEHNHCLEFFWVSFYTRIQASKQANAITEVACYKKVTV